MCSLEIHSLKNDKRQQLIDQELVENTEKLNDKSSYTSHKKKDNYKVLCVTVWETDRRAMTVN